MVDDFQDVVALRYLGGRRLWLRFDNGAEGEVDFTRRLKYRGMIAELRDPKYFAEAFVDPESGTVAWPNGVDMCPILLYAWMTGRTFRSLLDSPYIAETKRGAGRSGTRKRPSTRKRRVAAAKP